ncbi:hypothetical protein BC567DRAFT_215846, partial [Phyllosticta citribraziliensis]
MIAEASMIYIYSLEGDGIQLLTNVVCPRKALAMSMDASEHRFAMAVLLEGRMGMVCDLKFGPAHCEAPNIAPGDYIESTSGHRSTTGPSLFTSRLYPLDSRATSVSQNTSHVPTSQTFNTVNVRNSDMNSTLYETTNPQARNDNLINQTWNLHPHHLENARHCRQKHKHTMFCDHITPSRRMPLENGPHTVYRHLCSEDDPPRSVAICPQRRCVAFGCSSGIELHWIDAQTGQDLQRWFPLSAPSDFLFFLNPRPGVDSTHKLRIISSIAHPQDREGIRSRFFPETSPNIVVWDYRTVDRERRWYQGVGSGSSGIGGRVSIGSREFTNSPFSPTSPASLSSAVPSTDHYRAVPLSDGYHHLFTDPISSALYLGSDAPLGGGVKLLRKVRFIPPATAVPSFFAPELLPPTAYAVGAALEMGARIAAAYGSAIVLYNVPTDVLLASRTETGRVECGIGSYGCSASARRRADGHSSYAAGAAADAESCQCEGSCGSTGAGQHTWREWWDAESSTLLPGPQSTSLANDSSSHSSLRSMSALPTPPQTPLEAEPSGVTLPPYPHPWTPTASASGVTPTEAPWPLAMHGTLLGHVDNVVDLAVNESPELTVWAISADGKAESWSIPSATKRAQDTTPGDVDGEQRRFGGPSKARNGQLDDGIKRCAACRDGRIIDADLANLLRHVEDVDGAEPPEWWDDEYSTDDADVDDEAGHVDDVSEDDRQDSPLRFDYFGPATVSGAYLYFEGEPDDPGRGSSGGENGTFDGTDIFAGPSDGDGDSSTGGVAGSASMLVYRLPRATMGPRSGGGGDGLLHGGDSGVPAVDGGDALALGDVVVFGGQADQTDED